MLRSIEVELCRAFKNRMFFIIIVIGCAMAISHVLFQVIPYRGTLDNYLLGKGEYPASVFNKWMGGEGISLQTALYNLLLPCIAILPYGESLFYDKKSGYIKNILIKTSRINYYIAKIISTFLSGGVAYTIPLVINLTLTAACLPSLIPESSAMTFPLFEKSMLSTLFYTKPYRYILIYMIIVFGFSGMFACVGLVLTYFVEKKYGLFSIPLMVYMLIDFAAGCAQCDKFSPKMFLRIDQPVPASIGIIIMEFVIGMLIIAYIYFNKGKKDEIF